MYTISESLKPVFTYSGEFINHFYSSLTKDRPFWESIPLIILFTVVILPIILIFSILIILVLSGYEFNFFFNLISFRRGAQAQATSSHHTNLQIEDRLRRELETLTNMINNESKRLISNNATLMISDISCMTLQSHLIESSTDIAVVDTDSGLVPFVDNTDTTSTEIFRQNVRTIFNRINTRERELKQKLDRLAKDNETLRETIKKSTESCKQHKNNSNSSEFSSNNDDLMNESSDNEPSSRVSTTSIEVAIGLSSNVQCSPLSHDQTTSTSATVGNVRQINDSSIEHDDDDDAIYVILDEK